MTKGIHTNGLMTRTAGATVERGQLLKASAGKVVPCTAATDVALFIALGDANADELIPVAALGAAEGTQLVKATAAVAAGDPINPLGTVAAEGDVSVGRALEPATADELAEVAHQVATKIPVPATI